MKKFCVTLELETEDDVTVEDIVDALNIDDFFGFLKDYKVIEASEVKNDSDMHEV